MPNSQNGWPANNVNLTKVWTIPGTQRTIRLEKGNAGYLLTHFAAWFDKNIEDIEAGQLDDWGYAERPIRGGTDLSNHASGTAIDINALKHPLGAVNTFSPTNRNKIRAQLRVYEGAIRWGGDYSGRKDEMHFEINTPATVVNRVAQRLQGSSAPVVNPPVSGRRTIKKGDSGDDVMSLQRTLNAFYPKLTKLVVDGDFGDKTDERVRYFQRNAELVVDGIVGPKTWAKLGYK
jgi:hypothetical protein